MSNDWNPTFGGKVESAGFDAKHGKGVSITPTDTAGTSPVDVFSNPNAFTGTITGVFLVALGAIAANITIAGADGATICTIAKGTATSALVSIDALANTAITRTGTLTVVSDSAVDPEGQAKVFLTYKVAGE